MKKTALYFPIGIILFVVSFLFFGWLGFAYNKQVILFPIIVGVPTALLCLILILSNKTEPADLSASRADDILQMKEDFKSYCSLLSILPLIGIFGFSIGVFLYLVAFLKLRGERWYIALTFGIGTILFINGLFLGVLKVSLPAGLLGW